MTQKQWPLLTVLSFPGYLQRCWLFCQTATPAVQRNRTRSTVGRGGSRWEPSLGRHTMHGSAFCVTAQSPGEMLGAQEGSGWQSKILSLSLMCYCHGPDLFSTLFLAWQHKTCFTNAHGPQSAPEGTVKRDRRHKETQRTCWFWGLFWCHLSPIGTNICQGKAESMK